MAPEEAKTKDERITTRKNKVFLAVKHQLDDKEREKRKRKGKRGGGAVMEVTEYVDTQRNMAVVMGQRDVKIDVRAKHRREGKSEKIGQTILTPQVRRRVTVNDIDSDGDCIAG